MELDVQQSLRYAGLHLAGGERYEGDEDLSEVTPIQLEANEAALRTLRANWMREPDPDYGFGVVMALGDRNRAIYDALVARGVPSRAMPKSTGNGWGLDTATTCRGIAALQGLRETETEDLLAAAFRLPRGHRRDEVFRSAYQASPVAGTVTGVDLETTGANPVRGYIINTGWESMELAPQAEPDGAHTAMSGLPGLYERTGIPFTQVHHITWPDVAGRPAFRHDHELQSKLLGELKRRPFMAHNAVFEDSWLLMNVDGYAEARKAGTILPIDSMTICRLLDPDVRNPKRGTGPYRMENWARRRGVLAPDENERHLGLEDADLMLLTVREELTRAGLLRK